MRDCCFRRSVELARQLLIRGTYYIIDLRNNCAGSFFCQGLRAWIEEMLFRYTIHSAIFSRGDNKPAINIQKPAHTGYNMTI